MSQAQLALPELSDSYISLIESNKRVPTFSVVQMLARKLGCSVSYLLSGVADEALTELRMNLQYAEIAMQNGETAEALKGFSKVLSNPELQSFPELRFDAQWGRALALEADGSLEDAINDLESLTELVSPESEADRWAWLHIALCRCQRDRGDFEASVRAGERGLRRLMESHDRWSESMIMLGSTILGAYNKRGDLVYARQFANQLIEHAEKEGGARARAAAYWNAGTSADYRGDVHEALRLIERAAALLGESDDLRNSVRIREERGRLLLRACPDEAERARDLLQKVRDEYGGSAASLSDAAECAVDLAKAELVLGEPEAAMRLAYEALEHLGVESRLVSSEALIVVAHAHVRLNRFDEAVVVLKQAAEQLESMQSTRQAAQAWLELAELLGEAGDEVGQVEAYRRAMKCVGI